MSTTSSTLAISTRPLPRLASSTLSPTSEASKATAMYRKRRRDELDEDTAGRWRQRTGSPLPSPRPRSNRLTTKLDEDDHVGMSPLSEIQAQVEYVGTQIAQAQQNVAELRTLLLQAMRPRERSACPSSRARVRIDRLCS